MDQNIKREALIENIQREYVNLYSHYFNPFVLLLMPLQGYFGDQFAKS